jgi:CubicO group peptidase (beta-lactamase class C family)
MKLGEYLAHHILIPLGMHDTGFKITHSMRARLARIHMRLPDGGLMPIDMEIRQDPEFESGGGGLYSTVRDYLRFLLMILNSGTLDGATILSPEMIQLALTNQIAPLEVTKLASAMPGVTQDVEFFPGIPKGWGLIGMTNEEAVPGLRSAGSIAWAGLANTYWWIDKAKLQCGVIATQTLPFADPAVAGLAMAFERALG